MKTHNVSRRAIIWGFAALVAAMVADLLESLVDPASSGEGDDLVAAATQQHSRMVVSALLLLASAAFLLPGVYTLNRLLEGRAATSAAQPPCSGCSERWDTPRSAAST